MDRATSSRRSPAARATSPASPARLVTSTSATRRTSRSGSAAEDDGLSSMTGRRLAAMGAALLLAGGCTGTNHPDTSPPSTGTYEIKGDLIDPAMAAELQRTLEQARTDQGLPGASAAVVFAD